MSEGIFEQGISAGSFQSWLCFSVARRGDTERSHPVAVTLHPHATEQK